MTKTQLMSLITQGLIHEVFAHEFLGTFDVTETRRLCVGGVFGKPWTSDITQDLVNFLLRSRDIDKERITYLLKSQDSMNDPAICVDCPPDECSPEITQAIIDGTHRILARYAAGLRDFSWYRVPLDRVPRPDPMFKPGEDLGLDWGEKDFLRTHNSKRTSE